MLRILAVTMIVSSAASAIYWMYLAGHSPGSPDLVSGRTVPLNSHGAVTYVTPTEALFATGAWWMVGVAMISHALERWLIGRRRA
jgi:hypothetical protein